MWQYFRSEYLTGLARNSSVPAAYLVLSKLSGPLCDAVLSRKGSFEELEALRR